MKLKPIFPIVLGMTLFSISCLPKQGSDGPEPPPSLVVVPVDGKRFITANHTKSWNATVGGVFLSQDQVTWSTTRGVISNQGELTAPEIPSNLTQPLVGFVTAQRTNPSTVPQSSSSAIGEFWVVSLPSIQIFSTTTPMPAVSGSSVFLSYHFSDGDAGLYSESTLIQSGLTSGGNLTVNPTVTTVYTLKVTNLAGDSVTRDLTITVQ